MILRFSTVQVHPLGFDTMPPEESTTVLEGRVAITTDIEESEDKREYQPQQKLTSQQLLLARFLYISVTVCCYWKTDVIQAAIGKEAV